MNSAAKSATDLLAASSAARDVLRQIFMTGPVWDGDITSKGGRNALVSAGLLFRVEGWTTLTPLGMNIAVRQLGMGDMKEARDRRVAAARQALESGNAILLRALAAIVKNADGGIISVPTAHLEDEGSVVMEPYGDAVAFRYREPVEEAA